MLQTLLATTADFKLPFFCGHHNILVHTPAEKYRCLSGVKAFLFTPKNSKECAASLSAARPFTHLFGLLVNEFIVCEITEAATKQC